MKFIVIEIKDKDLFTIYDVENKGICCCSAYTLKQLLSNHNEVLGCQVVNGKLNVFECDLSGNKRAKKAPNCCSDTTKRSAVTIEKGLDEAHYPRVKAERKLDVSSVTSKTKTINGVDLHINDVKRFDLKDSSVTGMIIEFDERNVREPSYVKIYSLEQGNIVTFPSYDIKAIKSTRLTEEKRKFYDALAKDNMRLCALQKQYESVRDRWRLEEQKIQQIYGTKCNSIESEIRKAQNVMQDHINKGALKLNMALSDDYVIAKIKESLGSKLFYLYNGNRGWLNKDYDNNEFDIYIKKTNNTVFVSLEAEVSCRESRRYILDTFGDEEYDGTVLVSREKIKGKEVEPYFKDFKCDLRNGKKSFYYSTRSDSDKGYFEKNFVLTYEIKGIKEINKDTLKKIISEIK